MTNSRTKLQTQIFLWYSVIVLAVVAVVGFVSIRYITGLLAEKEEQSTSTLASGVSGQLDMLYSEMAKVSSVVVYNREVTLLLSDLYENQRSSSEQGQLQYTRDLRALTHALVSINGPTPTVQNINIVYPKKNFFTGILAQNPPSGSITGSLPIEVSAAIEKADGNAVLLAPHGDYWMSNQAAPIISVLRENRDIYGHFYGLVEVQQSYERFADICHSQEDRTRNIQVFDRSMRRVYPYSSDSGQEESPLVAALVQTPSDSLGEIILLEDDFYGLSYSNITGFLVAVRTPYSELMRPVNQVRDNFLLLAGLLIAVTFAFTFLLSRTIANPIRQLCAAVDSVSLSSHRDNQLETSLFTNRETVQLNYAFDNMRRRLQASADELARTRISERESYFYALQAQINPHFIHNVLANVGAIADEHDVGEISGICYMLSKILRYSLSDVKSRTTMETEFDNTETYCRLLQFRYGSRLSYEITLDPQLRNVPVPKLILQPLVENSILYGRSRATANWKIIVTGHVNDQNCWEITVEDQGEGFPSEALERAIAMIDRLDGEDHLNSEEVHRGIGGMGLANVAYRLKIFFAGEVRLSLTNLPDGMGARVTFRGQIAVEEGDTCTMQ